MQMQVALQLYVAIIMFVLQLCAHCNYVAITRCVLQRCHAIVMYGFKLDVCVITVQPMVRQVIFGPCCCTDPQRCKVPGLGLQEPPQSVPGLQPDVGPDMVVVFLKVRDAQDKTACGPCVLPQHML